MARRPQSCSFVFAVGILFSNLLFWPNSISTSPEIWIVTDLGKAYNSSVMTRQGLYEVVLGDLDNDGTPEAYVSSWDDGHIYNYSMKSGNWVVNDLGTLIQNESHACSIKIGDADDDGQDELYTGIAATDPNISSSPSEYIYQIKKTDTSYDKNLVGTTGNQSARIAIGDGDNDERKELFSADIDGHVYKYSKGQTWNCQDVGNSSKTSVSNIVRDVVVGDGHNDGRNYVYAATDDGTLYEINYTTTGWAWKTILNGTNSVKTSICLGDGDNDNKNEIYVFTIGPGAPIYRLEWNSSAGTWDSYVIASNFAGSGSNADIVVGDGNADGKNEIYSVTWKSIYQIAFDGISWAVSKLGSSDGILNSIAIGSIDDEPGQNEIYAAGYDGHLYQFRSDCIPPANPLIWSDTHPMTEKWYNKDIVHILWKDQGADRSGIAGYSTLWDKNIIGLPVENINQSSTIHESFSPRLGDGLAWYFHIRTCDGAGNWNRTAATFGPLSIDTTQPTDLKLILDNGSGFTNRSLVNLALEAYDRSPGSGLAWMCFSNDGLHWSGWEPFNINRDTWNLVDPIWGGSDEDGLKQIYFGAKDLAGNEVPFEARVYESIMLDRKAPNMDLIRINNGDVWTTEADVNIAISASDPEPASGLWRYALSNDGVSWGEWTDRAEKTTWSLTQGAGGVESDGNKTVYLRVSDRAGNIGGPVSATIFLDRRPPGQLGLLINGGAGFTNESAVSLAVHAVDPEPGSSGLEMAFSNDGSEFSSWEPEASPRGNWSLVSGAGGVDSDGNKTVVLMTRDTAGNLGGPVNASIFLDRVQPEKPVISINGGATHAKWPDVNMSLAAKDAEPSSGLRAMQFSPDGVFWSEWEPFSTCVTYRLDGPDGPKTIHFRVKDRAGNIGDEATATVILDTAAPVITGVTATGITPRSAVIMWQTGEEADGAVDYGLTGAYGMSAANGTFVTSHSILLKGLTPATTYHFRVASKDEAGNGPALSADLAFTTTSKDDFVPPMISDVRVLGLSDRLAVVGWTTNEPADGRVEWGRTGFYDKAARDDRFALVRSLTLEGLLPSTVYHFRVGSSDSSGNGPSFSPDFTFTTLAKPDITAPVISDVTILAFSDRQAVLSWKTNEAADTAVEYGTDQGYGREAVDRMLVLSHQVILAGLAPSTSYHFRISATDASGNGPSTSPDFAFMTRAVPDMTPPVMSGVKVLNLTGTSALIVWDTDEASLGLLEFGTGKGYGISVEEGTFTAHHAMLLQNLTPGRTYHFRVFSTDVSGNRAGPSGDAAFFTTKGLPGPDVAGFGPSAIMLALVIVLLAGLAIAIIVRSRRPPP